MMLTLQFVFSVLVIVASARLEVELPAAIAAYLPAALDVPITLQSLAVLTVAALLRAPYGAWAAAAYVFLGVAGAPVFAEGRSGWEVLAGKSGGYLVGFVVGAVVVARMNGRTFGAALLAQLAGTAVILALGALRLLQWHNAPEAFRIGVQPFLFGGALKALIGAALIRALR